MKPTFTAVTHTLTVAGDGSGSGNGTVEWGVDAAYNLTCTIAGGTVTGASGDVCTNTGAGGTAYKLRATQAAGWAFSSWDGCMTTSGTNNEICEITPAADATVKPTFAAVPEIDVLRDTTGDGTFNKVFGNSATDDVGERSIGSPETLTYQLKNKGTGNLVVTSVGGTTLANVTSVTTSHSSVSLASDATQNVEVTFTVATAGDFSFNLEIESSDSSDPTFTITVEGSTRAYVIERTSRIIRNFMSRRADIITANDPDLTSRLTGRSRRGDRGDGSFGLTGDGMSTRMNFSAATSLSRLMQPPSMPPQRGGFAAGAAVAAVDRLDPLAFGSQSAGSGQNSSGQNSSGQNSSGLGSSGSSTILPGEQTYGLVPDPDAPNPREGPQAGSVRESSLSPDRSPDQTSDQTQSAEPPADSGPAFDIWMKTTFAYHDGGEEGNGTASSGLLFDARVAYGQSSNNIRPLGTYEDTFDTTRWLARAQLTGLMQIGKLSIKPHLRVLYFEEMQKAYRDSSADENWIEEQTISLGRLSFGPTFSFRHTSDGGITFQPSLGIQGLWDFDPADLVDLDTGESYISTEEVRARVEAGSTMSEATGFSVSLSSFYDGIGVENVESCGGSFAVRIPLN